MSASNAELLRAVADAFNARQLDRTRELISDDAEFEDVAAGVTVRGSEGFIGYAGSWAGAFSDMEIETLAIVADENHAAGEFMGRGTHDGVLPMPTGEIPPTGRRFEERFTWFAEVEDGRITGLRDYYNAMALMTQLGLMPEASEAAS